ncbi:MAG: hypothetical protein HRT45_02250 [Bdellovibrionales bacterium]|nr:hypothetical protein [Bdellovibrionales bacterium]
MLRGYLNLLLIATVSAALMPGCTSVEIVSNNPPARDLANTELNFVDDYCTYFPGYIQQSFEQRVSLLASSLDLNYGSFRSELELEFMNFTTLASQKVSVMDTDENFVQALRDIYEAWDTAVKRYDDRYKRQQKEVFRLFGNQRLYASVTSAYFNSFVSNQVTRLLQEKYSSFSIGPNEVFKFQDSTANSQGVRITFSQGKSVGDFKEASSVFNLVIVITSDGPVVDFISPYYQIDQKAGAYVQYMHKYYPGQNNPRRTSFMGTDLALFFKPLYSSQIAFSNLWSNTNFCERLNTRQKEIQKLPEDEI